MADERDPAEAAAERRQKIEDAIDKAERLERTTKSGDQGKRTLALTEATNLRARAVCEHLGLRGSDG